MTSEEIQTTFMMQNLKMEETKEAKQTENSEESPSPDGDDVNQNDRTTSKVQGNQNGAQDEARDKNADEKPGKDKKEEDENENEEPELEIKVKPYPGLLGTNSEYVRLVSSDYHEFFVRRSLAEVSKTIREMLNGPNVGDNTVYFRMIDSSSLSTLCRYLRWQEYYLKNNGEVETFDVEPREAMNMFLLAGYLEL